MLVVGGKVMRSGSILRLKCGHHKRFLNFGRGGGNGGMAQPSMTKLVI